MALIYANMTSPPIQEVIESLRAEIEADAAALQSKRFVLEFLEQRVNGERHHDSADQDAHSLSGWRSARIGDAPEFSSSLKQFSTPHVMFGGHDSAGLNSAGGVMKVNVHSRAEGLPRYLLKDTGVMSQATKDIAEGKFYSVSRYTPKTLAQAVAEVVEQLGSAEFVVTDVHQLLVDKNFPLPDNPKAKIATALARQVERGEVDLSFQGAGNIPNRYKRSAQARMAFSGDNDTKRERNAQKGAQ